MAAGGSAARDALVDAVREDGWAVTPPVVAPAELDELAHHLAPLLTGAAGRGGLCNLLDLPAAVTLARSAPVRAVAEGVLGPGCVAVRGLLFDKSPGANWKVPWHQDLTVAVRGRADVSGFGPWSEKAGVAHAQAPAAVLERMLAVRVHLDACGGDNGPLRVLPRSHRAGKLSPAEIEAWKGRVAPVACLAGRGSILAVRPLLLHASSPAVRPGRRRVVHLEFAAGPLPGGLEWRWAL
jgi:ectoine hydroxylase-related dioxygenase (phytanoyl-CoA dioxygenase family)